MIGLKSNHTKHASTTLHLLAMLLVCMLSLSKATAQDRINIGAEIWIEPGQTQQQIDTWFKLSSDNNMRSARLFIMWNFIEQPSGHFDFSLYDYAFEAANKYGVQIEATLCAIHGPVEVSQKFHGRPQFNELFSSEEIMRRSAIYIEKTVTRYRDNKALGCWWILNEPRRFDASSPLATAHLQQWAKEKYGNIKAVNKAWIENYADFSQIKHDPLWDKGSYFYWPVPAVDWYQFQRDFLTFNMEWIAAQVRKHDTKHLITMNPANVFESAHQYDLPAYRKTFEIFGASMHASWQLRFMERNQYGYAVAGISEILRGAAPDGKFWISELQGGNNIWSGKTPMCPDSLDLAQWIWTGIGSGARKVIYWSLNYRHQGIEAGEWGVFGFRNEPTDRSRVTAKMNGVLDQYADFFKNAKPYRGKVSLLLSPETMRLLLHIDAFESGAPLFGKNAHLQSLMMWFVALSERGYQVDIKYLKDYNWETTQRAEVAILPNAIGIPTEIIPRMEKFVESGNKLIAEGLTGFFDEYEVNTMQREFAMERLLGARMTDLRMREQSNPFNINGIDTPIMGYMWKPIVQPLSAKAIGSSNEGICATINSLGDGTSVWLPTCLSLAALADNTRQLSQLAYSQLKPQLEQQPFYFNNYSKGALLRILENGGSYVTVITNNEKEPISVELVNRLKLKPSIIFGEQSNFNNGTVRLDGRQTVVIIWK